MNQADQIYNYRILVNGKDTWSNKIIIQWKVRPIMNNDKKNREVVAVSTVLFTVVVFAAALLVGLFGVILK